MEKGHIFPTEEFQLKNVEDEKNENHHQNTTVISAAGQGYTDE